MTDFKNAGRNDPCPCGSGKKFKKCHATEVTWSGNVKPVEAAAEAEGGMPQIDPSKMDLAWLAEFSQAMQRLPKGQLQRLQGLMQKAMAGKDVAREMEEFQRTLPSSFRELLSKSPELEKQLQQAEGASVEDSKTELSDEQKEQLSVIQKNNEKAGISKLWSRFLKK